MANAQRVLHLWHLTSLDAPTVAVTWSLAFAWAANPSAQIHLPWWLPTILGLTTWSLYITDRLLDANRDVKRASTPQSAEQNRMPPPFRSLIAKWRGTTKARTYTLRTLSQTSPLQPRHHYHWTHRRIFLPAAIAAAITALALVLHYMTIAAQTRNSVLALASLAYLTSVHARPKPGPRLRIPKELLVAIVFTAACTLPTIARIETRTPAAYLPLIPAILIFTALAWLNCQAIETWESKRTTNIIPQAATLLAIAAATLAATTALNHHPRPAALLATAAISALLIALLNQLKSHLTPTTLRTAADLALLTPLTLLAFQAISS